MRKFLSKKSHDQHVEFLVIMALGLETMSLERLKSHMPNIVESEIVKALDRMRRRECKQIRREDGGYQLTHAGRMRRQYVMKCY